MKENIKGGVYFEVVEVDPPLIRTLEIVEVELMFGEVCMTVCIFTIMLHRRACGLMR